MTEFEQAVAQTGTPAMRSAMLANNPVFGQPSCTSPDVMYGCTWDYLVQAHPNVSKNGGSGVRPTNLELV